MRRPARIALLAAMMSALGLASAVHAVDPIAWRSFDGGGVSFVSAAGYRLGATIGQPDAGNLAAGSFTLRGGFWLGGQTQAVGIGERPAGAEGFRFFPPSRNPVHSHSRVAFDLPRAARVTLSVFDLSGRAVRQWNLGMLQAGHQERAWDAEDEEGRPLATGVYVLHLDAGRDRAARRVMVLR